MTSSVNVLTTATLDSTPSLLISAPNGEKILINCGEGCQRAFLEAPGLKLKSVNRICLTHLHPTSIGGLPGLLLTTADAADAAILGQKQIRLNRDKTTASPETQETDRRIPSIKTGEMQIYGPQGIQGFVHSLRHFMRRDRFETKVYEGDGMFANTTISRKRKKAGTGPEKALNFNIHTLSFRHCVRDQFVPISSFIFSTPPLVGKFRPDQAAELGIPKGPLYAQLKQGESITFMNSEGKPVTVHSHQVVDPDLPGITVVVVYCPSKEVLDQLQGSNDLNALQDSGANTVLDVMVHITKQEIFVEKQYRQWLKSFPEADHLWFDTYENIASKHKNLSDESPFMAASLGATMRSMIHEHIYPPQISCEENSVNVDSDQRVIVAKRGLEYVLLPRGKRGIHDTILAREDFIEAIDFVKKSGALEAAAKITSESHSSPQKSSYEILFTGTGSALPCKHRNVSGICLTIDESKRIILDCGEGTLGQILRSKRQNIYSLLESIQAIWISHPHADHHLGILRILSERRALSLEPLLLIAFPSLFKFLSEYERIDPSIRNSYLNVDCREFLKGKAFGGQEIRHNETRKLLLSRLGITSICSIPVTHCRDAFAVVIDIETVGRIAYSGDCRPSMQFADAAPDCNILIHEATFEDGMEEEAVLKRHSTVGEALSVARRMRAKSVILTHFSQRYPKIPRLQQSSQDSDEMPIVFAFDYIRLTPATISVAAKLTASLRLLYPEEDKTKTEDSKVNAKEILSIPGIFAQNKLL
eukprot:CAMPEP_0194206448 /NCGR_PEP_ID=MMETSP0156-20130528/5482_1 /TAXON_ID=33649 /ORGANISM="Thalassionema nitzschioides, Strain L26-B" /LENGTH=760 /DNA_ID=CAMNT_0038932977 /DNA_START=53 /DNA_END=2335 /DNA_ORIENTATION=+